MNTRTATTRPHTKKTQKEQYEKQNKTVKISYTNRTTATSKNAPLSPNGMKENIPKSAPKVQPPTAAAAPVRQRPNANDNNSNNKFTKRSGHHAGRTTAGAAAVAPNIQVDPNYVTLTQNQLNTILSLVKTQHDVSVRKDDDSGELVVAGGAGGSRKSSAQSSRSKGKGVLGLLQGLDDDNGSATSGGADKEQTNKSVYSLDGEFICYCMRVLC